MSERMPPAEPAAAVRRTWWWRRRPPAGHTRFARCVWWAGHVQLPIAVLLLLVCLPVLVASSMPGVVFPGWFGAAGAGIPAWIGLAMAGPFAISGRMLRATSDWRLYWGPPLGARLPVRLLGVAATVLGIAALSVLLTIAAAYVILFVATTVGAFARLGAA